MRTNGFQRPFNPMQIGTWVLLPVLLLQFILFATPVLPFVASILCTIVVFACGMASAYFTYRCCTVDPMDERLRRHLARQQLNSTEQTKDDEDGDTDNDCRTSGSGEDSVKFCWVCSIHVHQSSMHCKFCDKCIKRFDHHCHWLNTCVGEANYNNFFRAVGSTLSMEIARGGVLAGLVISFFVQYLSSPREVNETTRYDDNWLGVSGLVIASVNVVFLVVDTACIIMLMQLFAFHVRLRHEGITTYAYIVRDGQRKQERRRSKMELERKRITALEKAATEGKLIRHWRLSAAGCPYVGEYICRPCDPLQWEKEQNGSLEMQVQSCSEGEIDDEENGIIEGIGAPCGESVTVEQNGHGIHPTTGDGINGEENGVHSLGSEPCETVGNDDQNRSDLSRPVLLAAIEDRRKMLQGSGRGDEFTSTAINGEEQKIEFLSSS